MDMIPKHHTSLLNEYLDYMCCMSAVSRSCALGMVLEVVQMVGGGTSTS